MSKRFTDTEKWKKSFIRGLEGAYKLLWYYILDDCDHAGIWHTNFDIASMFIGTPVHRKQAEENFKGKIIIFDNNEKWFIPSFIDFQYGELNPDNRAHKSAINILKKYNLFKGLTTSLQAYKDKDKDKDKDKVKDKGDLTLTLFNDVYNRYPRKEGKKEALRHFKATVTDDIKCVAIHKALDNYTLHLAKNKTEPKYIKTAKVWFNNWEDWVDYTEPKTPIDNKKPVATKTVFDNEQKRKEVEDLKNSPENIEKIKRDIKESLNKG